ncbi:MAG TPA: hypothetical protein VN736_28700 [Candidatus Limnocylindrales bacterium]|nr:hypothetical protein [Candidatus Limnocylindrales bacterium]
MKKIKALIAIHHGVKAPGKDGAVSITEHAPGAVLAVDKAEADRLIAAGIAAPTEDEE